MYRVRSRTLVRIRGRSSADASTVAPSALPCRSTISATPSTSIRLKLGRARVSLCDPATAQAPWVVPAVATAPKVAVTTPTIATMIVFTGGSASGSCLLDAATEAYGFTFRPRIAVRSRSSRGDSARHSRRSGRRSIAFARPRRGPRCAPPCPVSQARATGRESSCPR